MKKAFTLAEVLITLGIIGVVAAMTMPSLIQKHNEKVIVNQLKKVYSTLSQAHLLAFNAEGEGALSLKMETAPDRLGSAQALFEYYKPYMNIVKTCIDTSEKGCFPPNVMYKRLNGSNYGILDNSRTGRVNARLADGTSVAFFTWGTNGCNYSQGNLTNVCGQFYVDVNGDKNPNIQGVDYFSFWITEKGIIPEGAQGDTAELVKEDCLDRKTAQGWNCAAWVLATENLDYLHCDDLDLNTKTKCK